MSSGKILRSSVDKHGRTMVFTAVIQNKVEVLEFLLKKVNMISTVIFVYFVIMRIVYYHTRFRCCLPELLAVVFLLVADEM